MKRFTATLLLGLASLAQAGPLTPAELPPALRDWLPWASQGQPPLGCPAGASEGEQPVCVWPGRLQLNAGPRDATFRLEVQVFGAPARVALPGEAGAWPQDVKAGGKSLPVTEAEGHPAVWLPPGVHLVEGRIGWAQMPQNLAVPAGLGAIVVTSDGATQSRAPDGEGRLWLRAVASAEEASDSITVQTARLIDDDLPLKVTTAFELRVAGRSRVVELPAALLPGLRAMQLDSPLPARLAEDGRLIVQARPGAWHIELQARLNAPVQALKLPEHAASDEEVWVVKAQPALRLIRPEGLASVDPRQVEMPEAWRSLPAFRLKPGETLKLTELQRGNAQPAPDTLTLRRRLWLDFDGQALTAADRFDGQLSTGSRLSMASPGQLGRAALGGEDQPITRLAADGPAGFEVRQGGAGIDADSRWLRDGALPASGWAVAVDQLEATLQLPPGWRLLHAQGPSSAGGAWIAMWTLWDFFFVLLAALAAYRLLGWRTGMLLGVALVLTWHTPGSPPAALWFALLALTALARVLPAGRAQAGFARGRLAVAVMLALVLLPFAVQQVREAIYPSLEAQGNHAVFMERGQMPREAAAPAAMPAPEAVLRSSSDVARSKSGRSPYVVSKELASVDPAARVQTGPGLPDWTWRAHTLRWSGPVTPEQTLRLWLLPPWATALLKLAGLALLALGLAAVAGWKLPRLPHRLASVATALLLALGLAPSPSDAAPPAPAKAQEASTGVAWPSEEQLQALRAKVAAPPDCLPHCAELARLLVSASGATVQLRAEIHAQALVAVPLPGQGTGWRPGGVTLDGQPAATRRDANGQLWVAVPPGVHQVALAADVGSASGLDIALPLPPRKLQSDLKGWTLAGLDPRGQSTGAITLSREAAAGAARTEDAGTQRDALPPLVSVQRRLELGLRWQVQTHIQRLAPSRAPLRVRWALLPGEAVGDARVTVDGGVASLQLGGEEEADVASSLAPAESLTLKAGQEPNQVEQWTLAASTQWHVEPSGLAAAALQQGGQWLPEWRPWPGETLTLDVRKPAGVGGQTLTLDGVRTTVTPGERSTDVQLDLTLRASLGGPHTLKLPTGAELLGVTLNGQPLALQLREGALTLPVTPGTQAAVIRWREPGGMDGWWRHGGLALGLAGVNDRLVLTVPQDRIVLAVGGPAIGPAVLIWGVLIVVLALAWFVPHGLPGLMARPAWLVLALGVAPVSLGALTVLAGWFAALEARRRWGDRGRRGLRIAVQLLLVVLTLFAIGALLDVLRTGLLGYPDLLVAGPGSSSHLLSWTSDRFTDHTAGAWALSAPVWLYRMAMLAWALWLAASLLRWVGWAWAAFSTGGAWPAKPPAVVATAPVAPATPADGD